MSTKNEMRHIYTGTSNEPLDFTVSSPLDLTGSVTIELRFGSGSWITGSWLGAAAVQIGTTYQRQARAIITTLNTPAAGVYDLFARPTSGTTAPILPVGKATVH